jgi:hypothetical protein
VEVSIVAYRSRVNARAVVGRLWERICGASVEGRAGTHTT